MRDNKSKRGQKGLVMRKIIIIFLCLSILGCASINKTMRSWVGHHKSELILKWGPPSRTADDGKGGEILIYEYQRNLGQEPGTVRSSGGQIVYTEPTQRTYIATRMFWVDEKGIIYSWRWKGL